MRPVNCTRLVCDGYCLNESLLLLRSRLDESGVASGAGAAASNYAQKQFGGFRWETKVHRVVSLVFGSVSGCAFFDKDGHRFPASSTAATPPHPGAGEWSQPPCVAGGPPPASAHSASAPPSSRARAGGWAERGRGPPPMSAAVLTWFAVYVMQSVCAPALLLTHFFHRSTMF